MSQLSIVQYPHPVLRKKAAPVAKVTPEIQQFAADMVETLHATSNGVGLAAPQVGISLRIIVVDIGKGVNVLINPQIVSQEGTQVGLEGCLSLPGLHGDVARADRIVVRGMNARGKRITLSGEGFWARAIQHEIDHLDGALFVDRADRDTLSWVTGEQDEDGNYVERATTLEEALEIFARQAETVTS